MMKFLSVVAIVILVASCNQNATAVQKPLVTELDSVSYAIGMDVAKNVKSTFQDFDNDLFIQAFNNVSDSSNILIDASKAQQIVRTYFQKIQKEAAAKAKEAAEMNKIKGDKFLLDNKKKPGVVTTDSGLQYIVLKEGTGVKPTTDSKVKVHYHGTLIDGTVFDSSVDRGEPTEFGVTQVIKGWTEGLQLMKQGAKYKFFIPSDIAYGVRGSGAKILPNSTLIFDVELLEVK